jgi:hypothetical protein
MSAAGALTLVVERGPRLSAIQRHADCGRRGSLTADGRSGRVRHDLPVDLCGELVDLAREIGVRLELLLLSHEIMVSLRLLETCLPVLADHDKRRQEDGLE